MVVPEILTVSSEGFYYREAEPCNSTMVREGLSYLTFDIFELFSDVLRQHSCKLTVMGV